MVNEEEMARLEQSNPSSLEGNDADEAKVAVNAPKENSARKAKTNTLLDILASSVANSLCEVAKFGDRNDLRRNVVNLVRTFVSMNALAEGKRGLIIDGVYYRLSEYSFPDSMAEAITPERIQIIEGDNAVNFAANSNWAMNTGRILTPDEVVIAISAINKALKSKLSTKPISRAECGLLNAWVDYAIVGGKISSRTASKFCFLSTKFTDGQYIEMRTFGVYLAKAWFKVDN